MGQTQSAAAAAASVPGVVAEGAKTHTECADTEVADSASAVASVSHRVGRLRSCGRGDGDAQAVTPSASIDVVSPSVGAPAPTLTSSTATAMALCATSTDTAPITSTSSPQTLATSDRSRCSTVQQKPLQEASTRPVTSAQPLAAAGVRAAVLTAVDPRAAAVSSGSPDTATFRLSRSAGDDPSAVSATEAPPTPALTPSAAVSTSASSIRGQQPGPVPLQAPRARRPAYRRHPSPYPGREGFASVRAAARVLAGLDGDGVVASPAQARADPAFR
ncbi:hypothetical protein HK405_009364, partial [Cladochytrium tenue]